MRGYSENIQSAVLVALFLVSFFGSALPVFSQATLGARELGLGQAVTALPGSTWSVFANPAMMDSSTRKISFFGIRYYGLEELTDVAVAAVFPADFGVVGAGVYRFGDELFSESRLRLTYKNSFERFHYGIVVNYNHVSQGAGHGSFGAIGFDVGLSAQIIESFWFGAKATNINQPRYGKFNNIVEEPPRNISIGFSYRMSDVLLFTSDVFKDVRFPLSYRAGAEINIFENFTGRVGITTRPVTFSGGFGYNSDHWEINVVAQRHENPVLGISPGVDLNILW